MNPLECAKRTRLDIYPIFHHKNLFKIKPINFEDLNFVPESKNRRKNSKEEKNLTKNGPVKFLWAGWAFSKLEAFKPENLSAKLT